MRMRRRVVLLALLACGSVLAACGSPETPKERRALVRDIIEDCIRDSAAPYPVEEAYRPCIDEKLEAAVRDGDLPRSYLP